MDAKEIDDFALAVIKRSLYTLKSKAIYIGHGAVIELPVNCLNIPLIIPRAQFTCDLNHNHWSLNIVKLNVNFTSQFFLFRFIFVADLKTIKILCDLSCALASLTIE